MSKGFLVCDDCGGFYELQENDSVRDFNRECQCGGKLRYKAKLRYKTNHKEATNKNNHNKVIPSGIEGLILTLESGKRNEKIKAAKQLAVIGDERALKPLYKVWFKNDIYAAKFAMEKIIEREKIDLNKKEVLNLKKEIDGLTKKEEYEKIWRKQLKSWDKIFSTRTPRETISDPGTNNWLSNFKRNFKEDLLGNLLGVFLVVVAIFITAIILAFC